MPRSGVAGSYGRSIFSSVFFLRNLHSLLYNGCTSLHSTNSVTAFLSLPTLSIMSCCRHFDDGHSGWCVFHYSFDLLSLIISDVEQLFICFLAIQMSLEKCLLRSVANFFGWVTILFNCIKFVYLD